MQQGPVEQLISKRCRLQRNILLLLAMLTALVFIPTWPAVRTAIIGPRDVTPEQIITGEAVEAGTWGVRVKFEPANFRKKWIEPLSNKGWLIWVYDTPRGILLVETPDADPPRELVARLTKFDGDSARATMELAGEYGRISRWQVLGEAVGLLSWIILIVIALPLLLFLLFAREMNRLNWNPWRHRSWQELSKLGNPAAVSQEIAIDAASGATRFGDVTLTAEWLVAPVWRMRKIFVARRSTIVEALPFDTGDARQARVVEVRLRPHSVHYIAVRKGQAEVLMNELNRTF